MRVCVRVRINRMYDYYYAAQCVRGLRVCVRVCTYASIPTYICTCVRAHVQLRPCEGARACVRVCERTPVRSLVCACMCALTGPRRCVRT